MTDLAAETDDPVAVFREFGCPICGAPAESVTPRAMAAFGLRPCGHVVFPADAAQMKEFYRELWFAQLHQELP